MVEPTLAPPSWSPERRVWTVKATENWLVEILPMLFNFRIVLTPVGDLNSWEHGWCYFGTGPATFTKAVLAAQAFDPEVQSAPVGYDKALTTRL